MRFRSVKAENLLKVTNLRHQTLYCFFGVQTAFCHSRCSAYRTDWRTLSSSLPQIDEVVQKPKWRVQRVSSPSVIDSSSDTSCTSSSAVTFTSSVNVANSAVQATSDSQMTFPLSVSTSTAVPDVSTQMLLPHPTCISSAVAGVTATKEAEMLHTCAPFPHMSKSTSATSTSTTSSHLTPNTTASSSTSSSVLFLSLIHI